MDKFYLKTTNTGLLIIDIQEKMWAAMSKKYKDYHLTVMQDIIEAARMMELPTVVTEQYPKGLGPTIPEIKEYLDKFNPHLKFYEKLHFSAVPNHEILSKIDNLNQSHWIIIGIETHVCVYQTARDLVKRGYNVHVPKDGVMSRQKYNWETGLSLISQCGGVVTGSETILFDLLNIAQGEVFKSISKRLKNRTESDK